MKKTVAAFLTRLPASLQSTLAGVPRSGALAALALALASPAAIADAFPTHTSIGFTVVSGTAPLTGLWWNPNESGWGVSLDQQSDTIFATFYTYDDSGNPVWYVASNCPVSGKRCAGDLYQVKGGSAPTAAWNGANKTVTKIGTIGFDFVDGNNGSMSYVINGVSGSKTISRQLFYTAPTTSGTAASHADTLQPEGHGNR
jgi:hypothetical protein